MHQPTGVQLGSTQVPRLTFRFAAPAARGHLWMSLLEGLPRVDFAEEMGLSQLGGGKDVGCIMYVCMEKYMSYRERESVCV